MNVYIVTDGDLIEGTYTSKQEAVKHKSKLNEVYSGNHLFSVTLLTVSEKFKGI